MRARMMAASKRVTIARWAIGLEDLIGTEGKGT
jgi:hypothetical protein